MKRVYIDHVPLDVVNMSETVSQISVMMREPRSASIHVVTPNAQFVQIARIDMRFAEILKRSNFSVADGLPLVWACRLLGQPVPERVNGTDLVGHLCDHASAQNWSVYFLGGRPGSAMVAAARLLQNYPHFRIAGIDCPPLGFIDDLEMKTAVAVRITQAAPDILFVGLGAPKQEYWIQDHLHLPAKVMVGVGGSFELIAGVIRRAPRLLQNAGLEWLWRLAMEPRRLLKRYLIGNLLFITIVLRLWLAKLFNVETDKTIAGKFGRQTK